MLKGLLEQIKLVEDKISEGLNDFLALIGSTAATLVGKPLRCMAMDTTPCAPITPSGL